MRYGVSRGSLAAVAAAAFCLAGSAHAVAANAPKGLGDPGQLASVKIHTKWRSAAWWVGRAIANAVDIGFY